jgi:hypothetical protein
VLVQGNRIEGSQLGIFLSRVLRAQVLGNRVSAPPVTGYAGIYADATLLARIDGNELRGQQTTLVFVDGDDCGAAGNDMADSLYGVIALSAAGLELRGNSLRNARQCGIVALPRTGATRLIDNRLQNCGWTAPAGTGVMGGISVIDLDVLAPTAESHLVVDGCEVLDTGLAPDGGGVGPGAIVAVDLTAPSCSVTRNRIVCTRSERLAAGAEHRALRLTGPLAVRLAFGAGMLEFLSGTAAVDDNLMIGPGALHLVEFQEVSFNSVLSLRFERVLFGHNQCEHTLGGNNQRRVTVRLHGGELAANANQVKGPANMPGIYMDNRSRAILLGNISTGGYTGMSASLLPTPSASFNF